MKLFREKVQYEALPMPTYRTTAGSKATQVHTDELLIPQQRRDYKPFIVAGMLVVGAVILLFQFVVVPWWNGIVDHWQYGNAKVSELDVNVGHGGMSHLLAFEKDGEITILEIIGKKSQVYMGAVQASGNQVETLTPQDVNGDGKLDLIVHIEGTSATPILYNTGSSFSWTLKNSYL